MAAKGQFWGFIVLILIIFEQPFSHGASPDDYWDNSLGTLGTSPYGVAGMVIHQGELYIGGNFTNVGGITASNIARWDGSRWHPVGAGFGGPVFKLLSVGDTLYAGGNFTNSGATLTRMIAAWNGEQWQPMGSGLDDSVFAMASDGTNLYAGGDFLTAGGQPAKRLAKWSGNQWFSVGGGVQLQLEGRPQRTNDFSSVIALAWHQDKLFVGGFFIKAGDVEARKIAVWNGAYWSTLGNGIRIGSVWALAAQGNHIFVGGEFTQVDELRAMNVVGWNGTNWFSLGGGVDSMVSDLFVARGNLYAGGRFSSAGGIPASQVAMWDGMAWHNLGSGIHGPGEGAAFASDDTRLFVGGRFLIAGGKFATHIATWHFPRTLNIEKKMGQEIEVSWPAADSNFVLQVSTQLKERNAWKPVIEEPQILGGRFTVIRSSSNQLESYRLIESR